MSQCSNCYNNCVEITSDKCVRYTGVDVPILDIKNGDSLSWVEQALITFLTATIDGSGIQIKLLPADYCEIVTKYLPVCETVTALDLFRALVKAACDIQEQIDIAGAVLADIEAPYTTDCLTVVPGNSVTHQVLQAVITKLCATDVALTALALDVDTNYVKLSELNSLIAAYIAGTTAATRYYTRMVPFTAVAYFSNDLSGFDITGAGIIGTVWEKIYLCNGSNGTPDHRGRVGVGITNAGPIAMDSEVNPATPGNPNYALSTPFGTNNITLNTTQIPAHKHDLNDPEHTHIASITSSASDLPNGLIVNPVFDSATSLTGTNPAGLQMASAATNITMENTGGGLSHNNYQPGIGCYYIMYIP